MYFLFMFEILMCKANDTLQLKNKKGKKKSFLRESTYIYNICHSKLLQCSVCLRYLFAKLITFRSGKTKKKEGRTFPVSTAHVFIIFVAISFHSVHQIQCRSAIPHFSSSSGPIFLFNSASFSSLFLFFFTHNRVTELLSSFVLLVCSLWALRRGAAIYFVFVIICSSYGAVPRTWKCRELPTMKEHLSNGLSKICALPLFLAFLSWNHEELALGLMSYSSRAVGASSSRRNMGD